MAEDTFFSFYQELEKRHLSILSFREVRKALQSLSTLYVQRRSQLRAGKALNSAGKKAAFALFFGALHFLQIKETVKVTGLDRIAARSIIDLGCGTGVGGAAWSLSLPHKATVKAYDRNPWVLEEARWTFSKTRVQAEIFKRDISKVPLEGGAILLAFTLNELDEGQRSQLLRRLKQAVAQGSNILITEPISRRISPWLETWAEELLPFGGELEDHRFTVQLPERLALLDRAAGLDHRSELTCRSLTCRTF